MIKGSNFLRTLISYGISSHTEKSALLLERVAKSEWKIAAVHPSYIFYLSKHVQVQQIYIREKMFINWPNNRTLSLFSVSLISIISLTAALVFSLLALRLIPSCHPAVNRLVLIRHFSTLHWALKALLFLYTPHSQSTCAHIYTQFGFSVLPKDILAYRAEEPANKTVTFQLTSDLLFLLNRGRPDGVSYLRTVGPLCSVCNHSVSCWLFDYSYLGRAGPDVYHYSHNEKALQMQHQLLPNSVKEASRVCGSDDVSVAAWLHDISSLGGCLTN